jgi:hypothetical protein
VSERSAWKFLRGKAKKTGVFFQKRTLNSSVKRSALSLLVVFLQLIFFPASSLPAFPSLPSNGDAIQISGAPAARGARPALLCDEGAGTRFDFSRLKSRQGKIQIEVDAASKASVVISPALEEEGGVIALCSCVSCRDTYRHQRLTKF